MSNIPPPPPPPPGFGAPPPPPYSLGNPGYSGGTGELATWVQRVISYLIETAIFLVPYVILLAIAPKLSALWVLAAIGYTFYNAYLNGSTGQSIGKKMRGLKVVSEATGQPIGGGLGIARGLLHILDSICYIGYLFPLWDSKKQTFADKILKTVVIVVPK